MSGERQFDRMERLLKKCKILVIPKLRYSFDTVLMTISVGSNVLKNRHPHKHSTCVLKI